MIDIDETIVCFQKWLQLRFKREIDYVDATSISIHPFFDEFLVEIKKY